jgi:4'-phosphopantetheinyl transferase
MEPSVVTNEQTDWQSVDRFPLLKEGEVQVWRLDLTDNFDWIGHSTAYLSSEEKARADRRIAGRGREESVVGRACLRILLGQVFGIAPLLVPLTENAYGKPESELAGQRIFFNVSHTKGKVLIAVTRQGAVGVDVEHIDPHMEVVEVAGSAFTPDECHRLGSIASEDERRMAFYHCWTRKEAVAKADGRGLSLDLCKIDVPISVAQLAQVQVRVQDAETSRDYLLCDIPLAQTVVGAVAVESRNCRVSWFDYPLSLLDGARQNS